MNHDGFDDHDHEVGAVLLRQRMTDAVDDVQPDLVALVGGGASSGRRMVRARQRMAVGGVAAAVLLVAGGIAYGADTDLFGGKTPPTDGGQVVQLVPATPRGMAAAVMAHTDDLGELIGVGGAAEEAAMVSDAPGMSVEVAYDLAAGGKVDLQVIAVRGPIEDTQEIECPTKQTTEISSCEPVELADGTRGSYFVYTVGAADDFGGERATSATALALLRGGDIVVVVQVVVGTDAAPLDRQAMIDLITDPTVGMDTTAALNAAGEKIEGFDDDGSLGSSSDSSSGSGSSSGDDSATVTRTARPPR